MTFKFDGNITDKAIKMKISKWTSAGLKEKKEAHLFAGSMAMRYRDHGNYDFILEVADAIGKKWTRHARTAFIEWICGTTGLTYSIDAKKVETLNHEKGCDRTANFQETMLVWDEGLAPEEKKSEKGTNSSFWSLVKASANPFDVLAKIKSLAAQTVKHVKSGEVTAEQAKAVMDFAASMGINGLPTVPTETAAANDLPTVPTEPVIETETAAARA